MSVDCFFLSLFLSLSLSLFPLLPTCVFGCAFHCVHGGFSVSLWMLKDENDGLLCCRLMQLTATGSFPSSSHHDDKDGLPSYSAVARVPGSSAPQLLEKVTPGQLVKDGVGTQIYDITVTSAGTIVMTAHEEKIVQVCGGVYLHVCGKKSVCVCVCVCV